MKQVRVAIVDDHQSIIDGYKYRLQQDSDIDVVGSTYFGSQIRPLLERTRVDVLLLDARIPTSAEDSEPFPTLLAIPELIDDFPQTHILLISMHNRRAFIEFAIESGISGYLLKDDTIAMRNLAVIVRSIAAGGVHLSDGVIKNLRKRQDENSAALSERQLEAITLCARFPDETSTQLAKRANMAPSTMRNTLSRAYLKLDVHSRQAAVAEAQRRGLVTGHMH